VSLVGSGEDAADLEQELWHAALRGGPAQPAALRAWLRSSARNLLAMARRGEARRSHREELAARSGSSPPTDELIARSELHRRLLDAVERLPAADREAVLLRWFEELPPSRIAAQLDVPLATVHTRLQRAKERLRRVLDRDFGQRKAWLPLAAAPAWRYAYTPRADTTGAASHLVLAMTSKQTLLIAVAAALVLPAIWLLLDPLESSPSNRPSREAAAAVGLVRPDEGLALESGEAAAQERAPASEPAAATIAALPPIPPGMGRVVDQDGVPLAGVEVLYVRPQRFEADVRAGIAQPDDLRDFSDAEGLFEATPLTPRHYVPRLEGYCAEASYEFFRSETPELTMIQLITVPLTVRLTDASTGRPVQRFKVEATSLWLAPSAAGSTAEAMSHHGQVGKPGTNGLWEGTARFLGGTGCIVSVECIGTGAGGDDVAPYVDFAKLNRRSYVQVFPEAGQPLELQFSLDLGAPERLSPAGVVTGSVVDGATGISVAGVEVSMFGEGRERATRRVQTDAAGDFVIALPEGRDARAVVASHPRYEPLEVAEIVDPLHLEMVRRGSLRIEVQDGQRRALPGVLVRVTRLDRDFREERFTDATGTVVLEDLISGRYHVSALTHAFDEDEDAIARGSHVVTPGEQSHAVLAVGAAVEFDITGTVRRSDGRALEDVVPWFVPEAATGTMVRGNHEDGRYFARGIRPGRHLVVLARRRGHSAPEPFAVVPNLLMDRDMGPLDLTLPAGAIRGRLAGIEDPTSLQVLALPPLPEGGIAASVVGRSELRRALSIQPSEDGHFEIPHVSDGAWSVRITRDGRTIDERTLRVQGVATLDEWTVREDL